MLLLLVTGDPQTDFARCVETLRALIEDDGADDGADLLFSHYAWMAC